MSFVIGRPANGITINEIEYLLDNNDKKLLFDTPEDARTFLEEKGYSEYEIEEFFLIINDDDRARKEEAKSRGAIVGSGFSPSHAAAYAMAARVNELVEEGSPLIKLVHSSDVMSMEMSAPFDPSVPMNREQRRAEQKRTKKSNVKNKVR